jgi:hypothetical protein
MKSLAALISIVAFACVLNAGETLYNGIVLPNVWPPRRTLAELRSGEPMEVPYLRNPPSVIPIDVGRQLFVDDFLIEQTTLTRRFHKCELYAGNPVLRPDKRWEKYDPPPASAMAFSDGCFYDPRDKLFKIWYRPSHGSGVCYATSEDGIHWKKPSLDVQPGSNLTILSGQRDSCVVWLDLDTTDPQQRFKLFQFHRDCWRASVHASPDGMHWSAAKWCGASGDRSTMFYNPFRKVWVFSLRDAMYPGPWNYKAVPPKIIGRSRRYWETNDFLSGANWKDYRGASDAGPGEPALWTASDKLDSPDVGPNDAPAELYNLDAVGYESLMLGVFSVLHSATRGPDQPKINDSMLGFSRDGFHWHRPFREAVISVSNKPDTWNYGNVQSVGGCCLIVGDKLYFYASGRNATTDTTGLAVLRRDGFASMEAGEREGTLTTRPVRFSGKHLFVNAKLGELRVEVLDRDGNVILPLSAPLRADQK